jgi:hypothetical protein
MRRHSAKLQIVGWVLIALAIRGLLASLRAEPIAGVHDSLIIGLASTAVGLLGVLFVWRSRHARSGGASAPGNAP